MYLIRSHELCNFSFLKRSLSPAFSYSGWFFIPLVPSFHLPHMGVVAGALAGEDCGKKGVECLGLCVLV